MKAGQLTAAEPTWEDTAPHFDMAVWLVTLKQDNLHQQS